MLCAWNDDELKCVPYHPSTLFNMDVVILHPVWTMRTLAIEHPPLSIIVVNSSLDYSSCHLNIRSSRTTRRCSSSATQPTVEVRVFDMSHSLSRREDIYKYIEGGIGFPVVRKLQLIDDDNRSTTQSNAHRSSIVDAHRLSIRQSRTMVRTGDEQPHGLVSTNEYKLFFRTKRKKKNERREDEEEKHNHQRITKSSF